MPKEPQDHRAASNTGKVHKFVYDGKEYEIPSFAALPMGAIRKARKATDEADQAFIILEEVMPEGSPELAAIDQMDSKTFNEWLIGWTQGVSVGESVGSEN